MAEWLSDLITFLWAVINNWAGYATGGIIVALVGFWQSLKGQPASRKVAILLASVFLFLAVFRAWRDEHSKVRESVAYLEGRGVFFYHASSPFPINEVLRLSVTWTNIGNSPALKTRPYAQIFLLPDHSDDSQKEMIKKWKVIYSDFLKKSERRESAPLFPGRPKTFDSQDGPVLTEELFAEIFKKQVKFTFIISAVRFKDKAGDHEAHYCGLLAGVAPLRFAECVEYNSQVDIN